MSLQSCYDPENEYEVGVDEAGRGPLFGRLYVAGVVLPKEGFCHDWMKDSKRFHSKKKIRTMAEYIKENCLAYHIHYVEPADIDRMNIRQAVLHGMRECVSHILTKMPATDRRILLIDGNDFPPYSVFDDTSQELRVVPHTTVEQGDNTYTAIAAASILAKVARDDYIGNLVAERPDLGEKYGINANMGYGTRKHMEGIRLHGVTDGHRLSYGPCKST
jgi:ribonuclease HII